MAGAEISWVGDVGSVGIVVDDTAFRVSVFEDGRYGLRVAWQLELRPRRAPPPLARTEIYPS